MYDINKILENNVTLSLQILILFQISLIYLILKRNENEYLKIFEVF